MVELAKWTKADCQRRDPKDLDDLWKNILDLWEQSLADKTGAEQALPLREAAMRLLRVCRHRKFNSVRYHELADRTWEATTLSAGGGRGSGVSAVHRSGKDGALFGLGRCFVWSWFCLPDFSWDGVVVQGLFWLMFAGSAFLSFTVAFSLVQALERFWSSSRGKVAAH